MEREYSLIARIAIAFLIPYSLIKLIIFPITIYLSYVLLSIIQQNVILNSPYIIINGVTTKFVTACAAVSAYYLLMLLVLLTKDIRPLTRLKMFFLGSLIILIVNTIRVVILLLILSYRNQNLFETVHIAFWMLIGSIIVALTWIYLVKRYKVRSIPVYSDLKYLFQQTKIYKSLKLNKKHGNKDKHRRNENRGIKRGNRSNKKGNRKKK